MTIPRVYIACAVSYHSFHLYGRWVELYKGITPDLLRTEIDHILSNSPLENATEWQVTYHEYFLTPVTHNVEWLCEASELCHEYGQTAVQGYLSVTGTIQGFRSKYLGCFSHPVSFCQDYLGLATVLDKIDSPIEGVTLATYTDWQELSDKLFEDTYYAHFEYKGKYHIFRRD